MPLPLDSAAVGDEHSGTCLAFPLGALASQPPRYAPGAVLSGKYRLDSLLGEGGMGSVWRASNLDLDLPVAIKLIRADLDHGSLRARLQLEARSAAKLGHPAIVRVYDVGETELGDPFIVMELLHGQTLAEMLTAQERLQPTHAVQLVLPIIDALAMAHARGIVHRDLKPENVMIAFEDGCTQPKILDFGIAKLTDAPDLDRRLTEVGAVVGSPDYMSPEQARGRDDVNESTDTWSTCVVLYECITGVTPFEGANYNALLRAIVEDRPRSLAEQGVADPELWSILQRGLAKDRCERFRSILELGQALAGWLLERSVSEDACGTSVDSKWFPRSRAASFDSLPGVTGEVRTHRSGIRSGVSLVSYVRRKPIVFGAVAVACSLLLGKLAMRGESGSGAAAVDLAGMSVAAAVQARPVRTAATPSPAPPPAVSALPPPPSVATPPAQSATSTPKRSSVAQPRVPRAPASEARAVPPVAAPVAAVAPQPVRPRGHSNDLIAPY